MVETYSSWKLIQKQSAHPRGLVVFSLTFKITKQLMQKQFEPTKANFIPTPKPLN